MSVLYALANLWLKRSPYLLYSSPPSHTVYKNYAIIEHVISLIAKQTRQELQIFRKILQPFDSSTESSKHLSLFELEIIQAYYLLICSGCLPCLGLSGLYMAETLLRKKKETSVCVFEKEDRFGGRIFDYWFPQAPDISVGKELLSSKKQKNERASGWAGRQRKERTSARASEWAHERTNVRPTDQPTKRTNERTNDVLWDTKVFWCRKQHDVREWGGGVGVWVSHIQIVLLVK